MAQIVQLTSWISLIDASSNIPINRLNALVQAAGQTVGEFISGLNLPSSGVDVVITLPASPTQFVYIRNVNGAGDITVKWTPNGGAENTVALLKGANSQIILCEAVVGGGITTLKLNPSANNVTADIFLGA